jgi:hypothetical protein
MTISFVVGLNSYMTYLGGMKLRHNLDSELNTPFTSVATRGPILWGRFIADTTINDPKSTSLFGGEHVYDTEYKRTFQVPLAYHKHPIY